MSFDISSVVSPLGLLGREIGLVNGNVRDWMEISSILSPAEPVLSRCNGFETVSPAFKIPNETPFINAVEPSSAKNIWFTIGLIRF